MKKPKDSRIKQIEHKQPQTLIFLSQIKWLIDKDLHSNEGVSDANEDYYAMVIRFTGNGEEVTYLRNEEMFQQVLIREDEYA